MNPVISSPQEEKISTSESTIRDAIFSGIKSATITGAVAAVPTLVGCRVIPWAKHNLNHTAQTLIISAATVAGFFIAADKNVLRNARGNATDDPGAKAFVHPQSSSSFECTTIIPELTS